LGKDFCGQPSTLWIVVLPLQALWGDTDAAFEWLERAHARLTDEFVWHEARRVHAGAEAREQNAAENVAGGG